MIEDYNNNPVLALPTLCEINYNDADTDPGLTEEELYDRCRTPYRYKYVPRGSCSTCEDFRTHQQRRASTGRETATSSVFIQYSEPSTYTTTTQPTSHGGGSQRPVSSLYTPQPHQQQQQQQTDTGGGGGGGRPGASSGRPRPGPHWSASTPQYALLPPSAMWQDDSVSVSPRTQPPEVVPPRRAQTALQVRKDLAGWRALGYMVQDPAGGVHLREDVLGAGREDQLGGPDAADDNDRLVWFDSLNAWVSEKQGQSPVPYTHFINQLRILKRRRGPQSASSFKVYQKERMARVEKARALLEKHQMMMGRQNAAFDRAHTERMAREREAERIAVTKSAMEAAELATKAAQQAMKDEEAEARRRAARNVHFTQKPGSGSPTTRTPPLPVAPPHKKTEHIAKRPRSPRDRRDSGESTDSGRLRREKEKMPVLPISQDLGISGEEPSDIIDVNDDNDNDVNDDVIDDVLDDNISVSILLIESEEDESCSVVDLQDIAPDSSTHIEPVPPDHTNSEKSIPAPRPDSPPAKAPAKSNDKPHAAKPSMI